MRHQNPILPRVLFKGYHCKHILSLWGAYLYHVVLHEMFWNLKTWLREPFNREIGERSQGIMSDSPPGKFNLPPL